jgi:hypothetical protein
LYEKGGKTKYEHFRDMLGRVAERKFTPEIVSGLDNLRKVGELEWTFLTRLKTNRKVNPDDSFNRRFEDVPISEDGRVVQLKGFGHVKVFRTVSTDRDAGEGKTETVQYWTTNDLQMANENRRELACRAWGVETYHTDQTVLWNGAVPASKHSNAAQSPSDVDPGLPASRATPGTNGGKLLRIEARDHSGRYPCVSGRSDPRSSVKGVTPILTI